MLQNWIAIFDLESPLRLYCPNRSQNAIAVNEHNAKMGLVCATPTAGSAGCLPAVLTSAIEKLHLDEHKQLEFLLAAGAFGLVIANNASISGAEGGCQAEVGSAAAMSAAALTLAAGGSPYQASQSHLFRHQKYARLDL